MKYNQNSLLIIVCLILSTLFFIDCNNSQPPDSKEPIKHKIKRNPSKFVIKTIAHIGVEEAQTDEEEPYQISSIDSADCDKQGNIFLLDDKVNCVRVYNQSGKFLRKMFRRGKGPKEIVNSLMLRVNRFTNSIHILNEHGFSLKHFDLLGNYLANFYLPKQLMGYFQFASKVTSYFVSDCKFGETKYNNIIEIDIGQKKITNGFLHYSIKQRDDMFRHQQRFEILNNTLWTSTIDEMDLKGIDLSSGKVVKTIMIPGKFKKNTIFEVSYQGNRAFGLLAYNVAQPLVLDNRLFVLLTVQEYDLKRKPKWKAYSPTKCKLSLYQVKENEKIEKIADLDQFDSMRLECTYKNRIVLSSLDPYPHLKIVEVKKY